MRTISEPLRASRRPEAVGSYPVTVLLVLMWLRSAATPVVGEVSKAPITGADSWELKHTRAATDVVESELRDTGVELEQEREGLANATGSTEDGNLGGLERREKEG